ncbi:MAG: hypothetical protein ACTSRU_11385, partial [Candidatus Hodarchaeales archaeon]
DNGRLIRNILLKVLNLVRKRMSKLNITLIIISMILAIINAKPSLSWIVIQVTIVFISIRLTLLCIKRIYALRSFVDADIDDIAEFIELEILTLNYLSYSPVITMKSSLISLGKNIHHVLRVFLKTLVGYRNKIIAVSILWLGLFFLYWLIIQIILALMGYQYANGGVFQREIESNLTIINLFLVSTYIGITSGLSLLIWNHGDTNQKSIKRVQIRV